MFWFILPALKAIADAAAVAGTATAAAAPAVGTGATAAGLGTAAAGGGALAALNAAAGAGGAATFGGTAGASGLAPGVAAGAAGGAAGGAIGTGAKITAGAALKSALTRMGVGAGTSLVGSALNGRQTPEQETATNSGMGAVGGLFSGMGAKGATGKPDFTPMMRNVARSANPIGYGTGGLAANMRAMRPPTPSLFQSFGNATRDLLIGQHPIRSILGTQPYGSEPGLLPSIASQLKLNVGYRRRIPIPLLGRGGVTGRGFRLLQQGNQSRGMLPNGFERALYGE